MKLTGANPSPAIQGLEEASGKANYFVGRNPAKWRTNIPLFSRVKESNVYPGIDLVYHSSEANPGQLEYDFVVAPGADPGLIGVSYEGTNDILIDDNDLVLKTSAGELRQLAPVAYQQAGNVRRLVAARYEIKGKGRHAVSFHLGAYDHKLPLVIDPTLVYSTLNPAGSTLLYSTYMGGNGENIPMAAAVDSSGNVVVAGQTSASDFPLEKPLQTKPSFKGQGPFVYKIAIQGGSAASGPPHISVVSISGKKLTVNGAGFGSGAVIVVNGKDIATANSASDPSGTLISKKAGKTIVQGQTVNIQVRNPDMTMSNSYTYARPSN